MNLLLQWGIPLVVVGLIVFAFFAPRKEDRRANAPGRVAFAPGVPLRVSVAPSVLGGASVAAPPPERDAEADADIEPDIGADEPVDPAERLRALQDGLRDTAILHDLLADPQPAIRSAALDIAVDWHDLDAVARAMNDAVIPIAARAALEYTARTSQAACEAELNALDPAQATLVRDRLALMLF
jgi:hypothetical protein